MTIPFPYYLFHWFNYTIMAIATGFACGCMFFAPLGVPAGLLLGLLCGQILIFRQFFGSKRGKFEFFFLKSQRKRDTMKAVSKISGYTGYLRQVISEMGEISWSKGEKYQSILKNEPHLDGAVKFLMLHKLGVLSKKDRNYPKAISYFDMCLEARPYDLLSNYIQGECLEREGLGDRAIESYQKASRQGLKLSNNLTKYIDAQIERVKKKGPSKKPPNPGLMHSGLGR